MTSVVNSSTNQKPIITLSAQSLRGGATVDLREWTTLIFQGDSSAFFFFLLLSISFQRTCQHIDFTDKGAVFSEISMIY